MIEEEFIPSSEVNELTNDKLLNDELTNDKLLNDEYEIVESVVESFIENVVENVVENISNVFDFIKEPEKNKKLVEANSLLNIDKNKHNNLVFVYSAPKVGSTSIVSSLRLYGIDKINIIHIHDEEMMKVLANITDVTVNEIILFNKYLGNDVYVINVYRSPIERKISAFFEKIGSYHFNNRDELVNNYNINKIINRFNNIFPWISLGDHFIDKYNIKIPESFDYENKYIMLVENDIKYITLRLKDSDEWGRILTNIFGFNIHIIKDYESSNKPIKNLFNIFLESYKIPINLLNDLLNDKYLLYYYSNTEKEEYYNKWLNKSTEYRESYTFEQYKLYEEITIENSHIDLIQLNHYFDEGCKCKACNIKRNDTITKISKGIEVKDRIIHNDAKLELLQKRVVIASRINNIISKLPVTTRGKDFKRELSSIVHKKK